MKNFLYNLRAKLANFMIGRYGPDDLYRFMTIAFYVLFFVNLFVRSNALNAISMVIVALSLFRVLSKNHQARYQENQVYLKIKNKVMAFCRLQKRKLTEKDVVFRNCPHCKQTLRLPKVKGKHTVRCPKCQQEFDVRI